MQDHVADAVETLTLNSGRAPVGKSNSEPTGRRIELCGLYFVINLDQLQSIDSRYVPDCGEPVQVCGDVHVGMHFVPDCPGRNPLARCGPTRGRMSAVIALQGKLAPYLKSVKALNLNVSLTIGSVTATA